ncbi:MAG: hypothetical protein EOM54_03370 [Clostridia bacterium]|nr:hypothetical protein [Clostridia bacterium]
MNRYKALIFVAFLSIALSLLGCESENDEAYSDAYNEGYQDALNEVQDAIKWNLYDTVYWIQRDMYEHAYDNGYYDGKLGEDYSLRDPTNEEVQGGCEDFYWIEDITGG